MEVKKFVSCPVKSKQTVDEFRSLSSWCRRSCHVFTSKNIVCIQPDHRQKDYLFGIGNTQTGDAINLLFEAKVQESIPNWNNTPPIQPHMKMRNRIVTKENSLVAAGARRTMQANTRRRGRR